MAIKLKMFQVDAFASKPFEGNPAAIIVLDDFLSDNLMQNIAMENNLSETAFAVPREQAGHYDLRWFTPTVEIDFCGHATVASAHILSTEYKLNPPFTFHTRIGTLSVAIQDDLYLMDAPISHARPTEVGAEIENAFPVDIDGAFWAGESLYVVFENEDDIESFVADTALIKPLSDHGVSITAKSADGYDCISRCFYPAQGIDEDPVTGSAHAAIGPYWAKRLDKSRLKARQASKRGGDLWLDIGPGRVTISGHAVTVMKGEFDVGI